MAAKTLKTDKKDQAEPQETNTTDFDATSIKIAVLRKIGNPPNVSKVQIIKVNDHSARVNVWCRIKSDEVIGQLKMVYSEFYKIQS